MALTITERIVAPTPMDMSIPRKKVAVDIPARSMGAT